MDSIVSSEDLLLVLTVARTGSVGAAARRLQVTQPSASQRLARLERRSSLVLFERDTQGARPTPAGAELARQAEHILGHIGGALEAARAAGHHVVRRVGTIPSLADRVLPAFDSALADTHEAVIEQVVDHGDRLVDWLAEGTLDAAVLAIARQIDLPRSVRRHRIGTDELVLFLPSGVRSPRGHTRPLNGRQVVFATYDAGGETIRQRLVALGAEPRRAATVQAALGVARRRRHPAVVPRSLAQTTRGERLLDLPWRLRPVLDLLVPRPADPAIVAAAPALRAELGLAP
jgi:DNA-binding transcriptional LysR family regulator